MLSFSLPFCSLFPDAHKQLRLQESQEAFLETLQRVLQPALIHPQVPAALLLLLVISETSVRRGNKTVTRNRLIYRVIHKSGRLCIFSYAAKLLVVSPKGADCHSKVRKRPGWWNGKFTLF